MVKCYPFNLLFVNILLLCLDVLLAFIAFFQLCRIHLRNQQVGWTRQKVLHLMIGSSNCGYFIYFLCMVVATCKRWLCWSNVCGFVLMALPKILFLAAFLLLLSFWADLCHQANDEEDGDEEHYSQHPLLESSKNKAGLSNIDIRRKCCSFQGFRVGSRQKFVIVVIILNVFLMIAFAAIIRIGAGKNSSNSLVVARVYIDFLAIIELLMAGAFGCYGFLLFSKLRRVRSEKASSEMWKVVGLAVVSVLCFTSSSLIAILTDLPLSHHWNPKEINGVEAPILLILHYVLGSSVPVAFGLWFMRELPAPSTSNRQVQPRAATFITYGPVGRPHHHQDWATATSLGNQVSRASPI
ncbi:tobamovirus multiplication protein 1-like isoform X1 [Hibiscus syriacus]|uniref:tobamovirus multiplication protein 1-like isoform X1 n=3 Tax=Hibiscus syriacus TaxID=106335 RepID=UPI001923BBAB|nr:tobamovirus multiplication protein 1-like isoform X1 [Hibiscus syriacus]